MRFIRKHWNDSVIPKINEVLRRPKYKKNDRANSEKRKACRAYGDTGAKFRFPVPIVWQVHILKAN